MTSCRCSSPLTCLFVLQAIWVKVVKVIKLLVWNKPRRIMHFLNKGWYILLCSLMTDTFIDTETFVQIYSLFLYTMCNIPLSIHIYTHTRAVHKLLRKRKLKGTWKRYKLLHDWTQQLHVKYQSHGYTWPIAESIRRASPGGMRSTRTSQTLRQQIKMALLWLWQRQSFSMYTPCNQMHFIWRWTHFSYTYVQLISEVQMLLRCCLAVQYPSQFGEHHIVNLA